MLFVVPSIIALRKFKNSDQSHSNKINKSNKEDKESQKQIEDLTENYYSTVISSKSKLENDYRIGQLINNSSEYTLKQATLKSTQEVRSIKQWNKNKQINDPFSLKHQAFFFKYLDHPLIIKAFEFYDEPETEMLVTEYCKGGELFEKIIKQKIFCEADAAVIMYQILNVVQYLHEKGLVHRLIQPENFVFENKEKDSLLKLVSLRRVTKIPKSGKLSEVVGSDYYVAPEVLKQSYNCKCDLWSCGVIMYVLLSGKPPFNGHNEEEIHQKIINCSYNFNGEVWKNISEEALQLICNLLELEPGKRYSAKQALEDPWILKHISFE